MSKADTGEKVPKVSVCCSVLNQSDWLKDMIGSVYCQSFKDWELIVVDDGSTEDIKAVVDSFKDSRISYHRFQQNKGIPYGVNWAMEHAQGEYIQPLAVDELLTPDKLKEQVEYLDGHSEIDCVWGLPGNGQIGLRPLWEQNALRAHNRSNKHWVRTLLNLENVPIGGGGMLCRKQVFRDIGYFDPQLTVFSDHEWFTRFFSIGKKGKVLPYRWALGRPEPTAATSPRQQPQAVIDRELAYVRRKHPLTPPDVNPTVTVCIPVYNMAEWIKDALRSISEQTVKPFEVVVVDDCSTDDLATSLSQFPELPIRYLKLEENSGNVTAANLGIMEARGDFFVPLSADDSLHPHFIEKALTVFTKAPWLEFTACHPDFMGPDGKKITPEDRASNPFYDGAMSIPFPRNMERIQWLNQLYYGNQYFGVGMFRTEVLRELGGLKKECGMIHDYELYLNLLQRENIWIMEEVLSHTRLHERNTSNMTNNRTGKTLSQLYQIARADYYQPRMKVIIATPFYEMKGFSPYISSIVSTVRILTQLGIEHEFWELSGDSYVARARNTICTKFLEGAENTDLFFIDSDMHWNADAFVRMLMLPEGIVAGAYPTKNMWESWTAHPTLKEENGKVHPIGRPLQDGSALLSADTIATGFCRIKRHALEEFRDHYKDLRYKEPAADQTAPDREYIEFFATARENGLWWGEDRYFCKKWKEMGKELYIYPNVNMGHYGVKGWTGNYDKFLRGDNANRAGSNSKVV